MRPASEAWGVTPLCSICGGEGVAMRPSGMFGGVHSNPNVCRKILAEEAQRLAEKSKEGSDNEIKSILDSKSTKGST